MPKLKPAQRRKLWLPVSPEPKSYSLSSPHATEPKDWDMTRTWTPEPFQKQSVLCPEDLVRKPLTIFYHKWSNSLTLKLKSALPALLHTSMSCSLFKTHPEPWIRETSWSLASRVLAGQPRNKAFSLLRNRCHSIGFYEQWAVSPC